MSNAGKRFQVLCLDDPRVRQLAEDAYYESGLDEIYGVFEFAGGDPVRLLGTDKCEPEDRYLFRHYRWVCDELNRALKSGSSLSASAATIDALEARIRGLTPFKIAFREIVAHIDGDGGQSQHGAGLVENADRARTKLSELRARIAELEAALRGAK